MPGLLDFLTYALVRSPVAVGAHDPLPGFHWAGCNNGIKVCLVFDPRLYGLASGPWPVSIPLLPPTKDVRIITYGRHDFHVFAISLNLGADGMGLLWISPVRGAAFMCNGTFRRGTHCGF